MDIDAAQYAIDLEALRALPQRYARAVDERNMDALAALFHPEATVEGMRGTSPIGAYLETMRNSPAPHAGMHFLGDPLLTFTPGADEATSDTYAVVHQLSENADRDLTLGMRYLDRLVRHDGGWAIIHRRTVNLWMRGTLPG
jgi:hypothetical protein